MIFVIRRVTHADVTVENKVVGKIGHGLLVFVGVADFDNQQTADKMIDKMTKLRIFDDAAGKTNLSASDVGGEFLIVSQFTLYADCKKGNRPSFTKAGNPDIANEMYEYIISEVKKKGFTVEHGIFGADMKVGLVNDGPFTIVLNSEEIM